MAATWNQDLQSRRHAPMTEPLAADQNQTTGPAPDWTWALPGHQAPPAEALPRIAALCQAWADPYLALLSVLATHQGLPRERLAAAVQRFRPDLADLSRDDVAGLMNSIVNAGRQAFDATLRSRRKAGRKAAAAMWMSAD
jgi:hypothetical protein